MIRNWRCSFIMCSYETILIAFVLSCAMALRLTSKWLERFPLASCILVRLHTTTHSIIHQSIINTTIEQTAIQLTGNVMNLAKTQRSASVHADETLIGRWLPPAALASYLWYRGGPQGQHCPAKSVQAVRGTSNYYLVLLLTFDRAQTQKV